MGDEARLRPGRVESRHRRRSAALGCGRRSRQVDVEGPCLLSGSPHRPRRARVRDDEVPDDVRGRFGAPGSARVGERSIGTAVQDQGRPARDSGRPVPAPLLARRAAAGPERPLGRDVARRPAPAADPRLRAVATVAPEALSRASGNDGPLAGLGPDRSELRRPRAPRLLLHRELVDLARHHDPGPDPPGSPGPAWRLLGRRPANRADTPLRHTEAVPGAPKILAVASATDLDFRYGCTPAWLQIWKGLYEVGVDLIVTPYRGRAVESPWWRTAPNPLYREAELFAGARGVAARLKGDTLLRRAEEQPEDTLGDKLTRKTIWSYVTPRWQRHLDRILEHERDIAAVIVFTVPMSHLRGIPTQLRDRYGVPVVFYDGDVPMSLPEFGGMDTGFNYYHGADPSEYDLVLSNSEGGLERLRELGARRAEAVFWGADPELFRPHPVEKEMDVFFYGYGDKFRREWMQALIGEPSRRLDADFVVGGPDFRGDLGRA